jgi:alpha-L-fucosidase 2
MRLQLERATFPNLRGTHARLGGTRQGFPLDGNFAATAAITAMLLPSYGGEIALLPALSPA